MNVKLLISMLLSLLCISATAAPYVPLSEQCDGYPKLPLGTADNLCVGLLAQNSASVPLKMPRTAVETPDRKLLVVDMGGWVENKGKLWLIDYRNKDISATAVFANLNMPHKVLRGADGKYYLGEVHRIVRFDIVKGAVTNLETIVDNLPYREGYLHPLKNFVFDKDNNLIVNIGSTSDRCLKATNPEDCINGVEAGLRQYNYQKTTNSWDKNFSVIASGLRNSMALAVHASGTLVQAENSMDFPGAEEPYEELNIVERGGFYGWPLCYNRNAFINETKKSCTEKNYREPWSLIPPHVAPLDALYYQHSKLPMLTNKLLMTWHGYKIVGHRLVAFDIDAQGRPVRLASATYNADPLNAKDDFKTSSFSAKGGTGEVAQHKEIISRWNQIQNLRPKGAPAGMSVMNDGSLLIVDDKNAAVLRVSIGTAYKDIQPTSEAKIAAVTPPENIRTIFASRCTKCHEPLQHNSEQLLNADNWLKKANGKTRLEQKLFEDKVMPMPPDKNISTDELAQLKIWIHSLPQEK
ncbi:MAG: PQQ-dependent sugar dehydrogenase [Cellvibrio sp.]